MAALLPASAHRYDPRACGARCGECPLGPTGALRAAMSSDPRRPEPWRPVPPEIHPRRGTDAPRHAEMALIGQMPGGEETREGYPFAGKAGVELTRDLGAAGIRRTDVDLHNVIACQPPGPAGGAWVRMEAALRRLNWERAAAGLGLYSSPVAYCRPRLEEETAPYTMFVTLGAEAYKALTGRAQNILGVHGEILGKDGPAAPWRSYDPSTGAALPPFRLVPTVHPAFVLRAPSWRDTLIRELAKAQRVKNGRLNWPEPEVAYQPTVAELRAFLSIPAPFYSFDLETDGIEPLTARIRSFAVGIPDLDEHGQAVDVGKAAPFQPARAVGVNLLSGDGRTRFYSAREEKEIWRIMHAFLTDPAHWIVGANVGSYDITVLEEQVCGTRDAVARAGQPAIANLGDLLFAARFRAPDLPKGLKPNGRLFTDVGRWESDEKGEDHATAVGADAESVAQKDGERVVYNGTDVVVGCRITVPLVQAAAAVGAFVECSPWLRPSSWPASAPFTLWAVDHKAQQMCREMHRLGVYVDQGARAALHKEYAARAGKRLVRILDRLPGIEWVRPPSASLLAAFNPNSADQLRDLLYEHLALGPPPGVKADEFITDTGLPSTAGRILRAHLARKDVARVVKELILDLMLYRRETTKVLGTLLGPLAAGNLPADGRVRSTWNAHVTAPGRLASQGPNMQNAAKKAGLMRLRAVFSAAPGHVLLAGDLKQAHLRIIANEWYVASLRDGYLQGRDPYLVTAKAIFGEKDLTRGGWSGDLAKKPADGSPAATLRQAAKTYLLSGLYAAAPETKQLVIAGTEEERLGADGMPTGETSFPYLDIDSAMVARWDDEWHAAEPGWKRAWADCEAQYRSNGGWMRERVLGRRSGSLNDGEVNDVVNFPILAAEASLMRLVEARVLDAFPFECDGPGTGLTAQTHDGLVVEVEDRGEGENARRLRVLQECMSLGVLSALGWDVPIEADVKLGRNWAELG